MVTLRVQYSSDMERILKKRVFVDSDLRKLEIQGCGTYEIETKLKDDLSLDLDDPSTTITVKSGDCRYKDVKYYTVAYMNELYDVRKQDAERVLKKLEAL